MRNVEMCRRKKVMNDMATQICQKDIEFGRVSHEMTYRRAIRA